ncbi:pseudaminic acid cytidylyltransferase [Pelagibacterales bacterium SAG-MED48]|nr:pseudaminic acid cytidylyltransferase [Pelagibacterales bacterium SAG-MED48]
MNLNNIAIIPARGGSKRIPKKNIKDFLGKPIIAYSIEMAISCKLFNKVIVSTDDQEIKDVAIKYGAEIPFIRPKEIADDFTGTHEVIGHAVKWMEDNDEKMDYVCCVYPTAPLIEKDDLKKGFELIKTGKWDSVMAATNFSYPIFRSFENLPDGGLKMIFPEHYNSRSQDLPEIYHDAGLFCWAKPETWKKKPEKYCKKNSIIKIPNHRIQDIDTLDDWKRAEIIYKIKNRENS